MGGNGGNAGTGFGANTGGNGGDTTIVVNGMLAPSTLGYGGNGGNGVNGGAGGTGGKAGEFGAPGTERLAITGLSATSNADSGRCGHRVHAGKPGGQAVVAASG